MSGKSIFAALAGLALLLVAEIAACASYVDIERRLTPEQMRATGLDTLSPQQLELLNRLLREAPPAAAGSEATTTAVTTTAATTTAPPAAVEPAASPAARLQELPIRGRVQGTVEGWEPGTVFVLDNGQRWQVLKGRAELRQPLQSPEVLVVPGLAGRYFLQVDEDLPKARVYRID